jgi:polyisoprenoid-binding protein YceI
MCRVILLVSLMIAPAWAERLPVLPPGSGIAIRVYGLGLLSMDGSFSRFHGWMSYDPANPDACQASLEMSHGIVRDTIIGPEFLDARRFPTMVFRGACQGDVIVGDLLLHGQTRPFSLDREETRANGTLVASGRLHRADWGITARRFSVGQTIRIRLEIPMNGSHT